MSADRHVTLFHSPNTRSTGVLILLYLALQAVSQGVLGAQTDQALEPQAVEFADQ